MVGAFVLSLFAGEISRRGSQRVKLLEWNNVEYIHLAYNSIEICGRKSGLQSITGFMLLHEYYFDEHMAFTALRIN